MLNQIKWIYKELINVLHFQILTSTKNGRIQKSRTGTINLKYQKQHVMKNLKYLMVSYYYLEVSNFVSNIQDYFKHIIKKHETLTGKSLIQIYVDKVQNRITLKIKTGYCLEYLTPGIMKVLKER